ncbi:MAG: hypothetical protein QME74_11265 [Candidatus Edwardsbacteria bacterium]|nr:hypothetical protein [Candidatus Edwardsbacteria bacterium]
MTRILRQILFVVLVTASGPGRLSAAARTLVREYGYEATDLDSRLTCRAIALEQVKRSMLEELGTHLEAKSECSRGMLVRDDIMTLTAGIVQIQILGETWDGRNFWIKARMDADPDSVMSSLRKLMEDRDRAKELLELKTRTDQALDEIDRLRRELAAAKSDNLAFARQISYLKQAQILSSSALACQGIAHTVAGENGQALAAFTKALENDTTNAIACANRGVLYARAGDHLAAWKDYTSALKLSPRNAAVLYSSIQNNCNICLTSD